MPISKLDVACELLDRALRLYFDGDSYCSSLHLAGAAEEILGEYLRRAGRSSAFNEWRTAGVELANTIDGGNGDAWTAKSMQESLNHAKNRIKHMDLSGDEVIKFIPADEAREYLERAVSNYYQLMNVYQLVETELIARFNIRQSRSG